MTEVRKSTFDPFSYHFAICFVIFINFFFWFLRFGFQIELREINFSFKHRFYFLLSSITFYWWLSQIHLRETRFSSFILIWRCLTPTSLWWLRFFKIELWQINFSSIRFIFESIKCNRITDAFTFALSFSFISCLSPNELRLLVKHWLRRKI